MKNTYSRPPQEIPSFLSTVSLSWLMMVLATSAQAEVASTTFQNYNASGTQQTTPLLTEPGAGGVTVRTGLNAADTQPTSVATVATGTYSIQVGTVPAGTPVRVEFSGYSAGSFVSANGTNHGTANQFITASATGIDLGIVSQTEPDTYLGTNIYTSWYVKGDPTAAGSQAAPEPAIIQMGYYNFNKSVNTNMNRVGSIWGLAYSKNHNRLHEVAVVRHHAGFEPKTPTGGTIVHLEASFGGMTRWLLDSNQIVMSGLAPENTRNSGGFIWRSNQTGKKLEGQNVYTNENFAKAISLSDAELIAKTVTLSEIGNRIWSDMNGNGIQDGGDAGIAAVTVTLYQSTSLIATTTTDDLGEYYFNDSNVPGGLLPNTTYEIRAGTTQAQVQNLTLTTANAGSDPELDSDATLNGTDAVITLTTSATVGINHSYDIGFRCYAVTGIASPTVVCAGDSFTLSAGSSAPGSVSYAWAGPGGYAATGPVQSRTNVTAAMSGSYVVTMSVPNAVVGTVDQVVNGNFSTTGGYLTSYSIVTAGDPAPVDGQVRQGTVATLDASLGFAACGDHTTGLSSGEVLFINAGSDPTLDFWRQTYTVTANTTYQLKFYIQNGSSNNPPKIQALVDGTALAPDKLVDAAQCTWMPFVYTFTTTTTSTTISLFDSETNTSGNYFLLDDISLNSFTACTSQDMVSVIVNPSPTPTLPGATICAGQSTVLTVQNCAGTVQWSANANSATTQSVTVSPSATTAYNVSCTVDGCTGSASATVTVNGQPQINSISQSTFCIGNTASLTVNATNTGSETLEYSLNGGAFTTNNSFTLNAPTTTTATVTVRTQGSSCTATESVVVNCSCQTPVSLTFVPTTLHTCAGSPVSFTVGVSGATSASLTSTGTGIFSQSVITELTVVNYEPSLADATTGSVTITLQSADPDGVGSCVAGQLVRVLSIDPLPIVSLTSATVCAGSSATLTASGANSYTFSPSSGVQAGNLYRVTPNQTTVYSVTGQSVAGCANTDNGTVTLSPLPSAGADQMLVCEAFGLAPASTTLTASDVTSGQWSAAAGNPTSTTFSAASSLNTTVSGMTVPGTYSFVFTNPQSCSDEVTVTVPPCACTLTMNATSSSPTLMLGQALTLTAVVSPTGAYTYVWSGPNGVVFTPNNASAVVASNLPVGTSTLSVTAISSNPACFTTATVSVTVLHPVLDVMVDTPICNTLTNHYTATGTVSLTNCPAGSLTITDNGTTLAVVSVSAGQTSVSFSVSGVSASSPASRTVIATLDNVTASTTYATPASCTVCSLSVTASAAVTICAGQSATLTASAMGGAPAYSYAWQPSATLSGANTATAIATPSATTMYSVVVTDAQNCTALATVTVTVNGQPALVSLVRGTCVGNLVSVTANASLTGAGTLEYSFNGRDFQPANATTITANGPTLVTVVVQTMGSTCSVTQSIIVDCACQTPANVSLLPASPATCNQTPASLTASVGGGATSATLTSSGTGAFSNAVVTGSATVSYTPSVADATAGSVTLTLTSDDPDGAGSCLPATQSRVLLISPVSACVPITVRKVVR